MKSSLLLLLLIVLSVPLSLLAFSENNDAINSLIVKKVEGGIPVAVDLEDPVVVDLNGFYSCDPVKLFRDYVYLNVKYYPTYYGYYLPVSNKSISPFIYSTPVTQPYVGFSHYFSLIVGEYFVATSDRGYHGLVLTLPACPSTNNSVEGIAYANLSIDGKYSIVAQGKYYLIQTLTDKGYGWLIIVTLDSPFVKKINTDDIESAYIKSVKLVSPTGGLGYTLVNIIAPIPLVKTESLVDIRITSVSRIYYETGSPVSKYIGSACLVSLDLYDNIPEDIVLQRQLIVELPYTRIPIMPSKSYTIRIEGNGIVSFTYTVSTPYGVISKRVSSNFTCGNIHVFIKSNRTGINIESNTPIRILIGGNGFEEKVIVVNQSFIKLEPGAYNIVFLDLNNYTTTVLVPITANNTTMQVRLGYYVSMVLGIAAGIFSLLTISLIVTTVIVYVLSRTGYIVVARLLSVDVFYNLWARLYPILSMMIIINIVLLPLLLNFLGEGGGGYLYERYLSSLQDKFETAVLKIGFLASQSTFNILGGMVLQGLGLSVYGLTSLFANPLVFLVGKIVGGALTAGGSYMLAVNLIALSIIYGNLRLLLFIFLLYVIVMSTPLLIEIILSVSLVLFIVGLFMYMAGDVGKYRLLTGGFITIIMLSIMLYSLRILRVSEVSVMSLKNTYSPFNTFIDTLVSIGVLFGQVLVSLPLIILIVAFITILFKR